MEKYKLHVVFVRVLMKITIGASLEKNNKWSKPTTWETSKGSSPTMILIPTPIIPDGETTLTLVGEDTRIKEATTSKTVHLIHHFKDHHFHNQQIYHHHLNRNHLNQILL
ncbi:hypothetical protein PIB30_110489, partial [Stylosanthes scabra]|nr:hypothetical protein [Stylosanthes scabra]